MPRKCPACEGEPVKHDRRCPDKPKRAAQPYRPHVLAVLLSDDEQAQFNVYRNGGRGSEVARGLVKEGTATKIRPIMAHNTSPNGGDCWSEADFATLPLDNRAGINGCRLEVPVEDGAIVRLYPVEEGAMPQWLAGGWYWVMA